MLYKLYYEQMDCFAPNKQILDRADGGWEIFARKKFVVTNLGQEMGQGKKRCQFVSLVSQKAVISRKPDWAQTKFEFFHLIFFC
jgi:hypothetical protein